MGLKRDREDEAGANPVYSIGSKVMQTLLASQTARAKRPRLPVLFQTYFIPESISINHGSYVRKGVGRRFESV